jgi:RpiR family carbohydrate utilization transcriptional regulator
LTSTDTTIVAKHSSGSRVRVAMDGHTRHGPDFLERMRGTMLSLSNSERRVARLCLQDPNAFANLPVSKIANSAHVSNPTVIRFCRKAGYVGLVDLKQTIQREVKYSVPFIFGDALKKNPSMNIAHRVLDNVLATMLRFRSAVRIDQIQQAVERLSATYSSKGRVFLVGVGASAMVAHDAKDKLYRLGVNAHSFSQTDEQIVSVTIADEHDTLIVFSNSGRTRDAMKVCEIANDRGLATIVVTASDSPLYSIGTLPIASDTHEFCEGFTPMLSRLQLLAIVDILTASFALELNADSVAQKLAQCEKQLNCRRL